MIRSDDTGVIRSDNTVVIRTIRNANTRLIRMISSDNIVVIRIIRSDDMGTVTSRWSLGRSLALLRYCYVARGLKKCDTFLVAHGHYITLLAVWYCYVIVVARWLKKM